MNPARCSESAVTPGRRGPRGTLHLPHALALSLAVLAVATLAGCASTDEPDRAGSLLARTAAPGGTIDPEADRLESERSKEERRRVVESTLVWIVAETAARASEVAASGATYDLE